MYTPLLIDDVSQIDTPNNHHPFRHTNHKNSATDCTRTHRFDIK